MSSGTRESRRDEIQVPSPQQKTSLRTWKAGIDALGWENHAQTSLSRLFVRLAPTNPPGQATDPEVNTGYTAWTHTYLQYGQCSIFITECQVSSNYECVSLLGQI
jgi:hypothetical protein